MITRAEPAGVELGGPDPSDKAHDTTLDERASPAPVVFLPEPGACAGRLDPGQDLVPESLADLVDYHVWPSASPYASSAWARTVCEHIDWPLVWQEHPDWFVRRAQVGAPAPGELWEARRVLAEFGVGLAFDVQLEQVDGELGLAVYGAGVVGRLSDTEWRAVAGLLMTCCSTLHEPRADVAAYGRLIRPARPTVAGQRPLPSPVQPAGWLIGDWLHTWWSYPIHGILRESCTCTAHTAVAATVHFGPNPERRASA